MPSRARLLALLLLVVLPAAAQPSVYGTVYRPPGTRYLVLPTPHFEVIFEAGFEDEAREAARLLEASLPATQRLVGTDRTARMPVVLNGFNDRANGYVTAAPFKQEVEVVAARSAFFTPRYTSWLEQVMPHELTHAVQADHRGGFGVTSVVRWFAPDAARSFNLILPAGLSEGLAVYRESAVVPGAGRLNDPLFKMQYRAAVAGDAGAWTLAEMLERNAYTRPFGRWYVGGALFVESLAAADSARFFRRGLDLHARFPFLGYGLELWYATGTPPWIVGRRLRTALRTQEAARVEARVEALGPLTEPRVVASARGLAHRRPLWLGDRTLLVHADGYDLRPGFYRYDVETGRRTLVAHEDATDDHAYSLDRDGRVLFARYVQDPFVPIRSVADVFRLDPSSGRTERLTRGARAFAPVEAPDGGVWALRNGGAFNDWVHVAADSVEALTDAPRVIFKRILPSPDGRTVLVLAAVRGRQGLFRADRTGGTPTLSPLLLFEDGPIYDAEWSADGRWVLFAAAPDNDVADVFAWDARTDRVLRLTRLRYGARTPALSPDGTTVAFVRYRHERYDLATLPFRPDAAEVVPRALAAARADLPWAEWTTEAYRTDDYADVPVRPYRALGRLAPRMFVPLFELDESVGGRDGLGPLAGLALVGTDPLQRIAYGAQAYWQNGRAWGEAGVQTARFRLRPALSVYDTPSALLARTSGGGLRAIGREEQGVALGLRLPVTLSRNVFTTTAEAGLRIEFERARLFDLDGGETLVEYRAADRRQVTVQPSARLAYRLQGNPRDLVPNTGVVLSASAVADGWVEGEADLRRGAFTSATAYLPWLRRANVGLRVTALAVSQSRGGIYDLDGLLPRGYDTARVPERLDYLADGGTVLRYGAETTVPLAYPENGLLVVPVTVAAVYAFGFGETLHPADDWGRARRASSVGAGVGARLTLFHALRTTVRLGAAYRPEEGDVRALAGVSAGW